MMVQYREDLIEKRILGLSAPDIDTEGYVYEVEDYGVQDMAQSRADAGFMFETGGGARGSGCGGLGGDFDSCGGSGGCGGEVWLYESLAIGCCEWVAVVVGVGLEDARLAGAYDHVGVLMRK